jgi:hypothetical protein
VKEDSGNSWKEAKKGLETSRVDSRISPSPSAGSKLKFVQQEAWEFLGCFVCRGLALGLQNLMACPLGSHVLPDPRHTIGWLGPCSANAPSSSVSDILGGMYFPVS